MDITNINENMGNVDRVVRALAAAIFVVAFFNGVTTGVLGIISLVVAVAFLANAIFGYCVFYSLLGLKTKWNHS